MREGCWRLELAPKRAISRRVGATPLSAESRSFIMSSQQSYSGPATAFGLVGIMVLAIPAGLALDQGLTASPAETDPTTIITPTPPPVKLTDTPTPTPTPTPAPDGDTNNTEGATTTGKTHFVNAVAGLADGETPDGGCATAKYKIIQAAVEAAESGDTVAVCAGTYSEHVRVTTANLTIRARGDVLITNTNESAVWINAPNVVLHGFNIRVGEGANYAIEVGGKEVDIRNNTVHSPRVGIFLSDGHIETGECRLPGRKEPQYTKTDCDRGPPVDKELGAATGGRVVNNSVTAGMLRLWVDADQTLIQSNFVTDLENPKNAPNYPECRTGDIFDPCKSRFNDSIVSSGNGTIISGNAIRIKKEPTGIFHHQAGIMIGKTPTQGHNMALNNTVANNFIHSPIGVGIKTRNITTGASIRNNTITSAGTGMRIVDEAVIRNNEIDFVGTGIRVESFRWGEVQNYQEKQALIVNNTLDSGDNKGFTGIRVTWNAVIKGNTIKNIINRGIRIGICRGGGGRVVNNKITGMGDGIFVSPSDYRVPCPTDLKNNRIMILNNQIMNNEYGIKIRDTRGEGHTNPNLYEIHGNLINNNEELGIWNRNKSVIVNATDNIWACGGPSGGANPLADPYTGRLANGSGDLISAGNGSRNGHTISNVHFDPFQVLASCPESGSPATTTPTPTLTPTPTSTPSLTPTPTPTAAGGIGNGTDGVGGNGTGGTGGNGTGGNESGDVTIGDNGPSVGTPHTITPPPTPTETPLETPTISPTPRVEPGFGVGMLAIAIAILISLFTLRRSELANRKENHD